MAGEWFFADLVFPNQLPPEHEFVRNVLAPVYDPDMLRRILEARGGGRFIERAETLHATGAPMWASPRRSIKPAHAWRSRSG